MVQAQAVNARIHAIGLYFPEMRLGNEQLAQELEGWTAEKILEKTGIRERRIAGPDETALDLAEKACLDLFGKDGVNSHDVDFILFCTQAPDYFLPTSACILQDRLGLPKSIGALDINLGCSGYVYGLSLAAGLIASGAARNVMLVTADTYSKFINAKDRSVRTLFGDGATASLVAASDDTRSFIGSFVFGTDGSGAKHLMVPAGGARLSVSQSTKVEKTDLSGNVRSEENLFMDGAAVMTFSLAEVPKCFTALLSLANKSVDDVDHVVLHQANRFMLDALRKKMKVPLEKLPYRFEDIGNTVSSTIPIVLEELISSGQFVQGKTVALIGFGVGLSWAACMVSL